MKIGSPAEKPVVQPAGADAKAASAPAAPAAGKAAGDPSAKVLLSDAVTQLLTGNEAVVGEFDSAKVEAMSTAIAQGKFVVDHAAVADKLIANAKELLGKSSH